MIRVPAIKSAVQVLDGPEPQDSPLAAKNITGILNPRRNQLKKEWSDKMDVEKSTAPCGLACFACAIHKDNITDNLAQHTAEALGIAAEDVPCEGCRSEGGCSVSGVLAGEEGCLTKSCVESKGLHNCSECGEFPCENLMPVADGAMAYPHNTKLYNLSRIKLIGLEAWAAEAAMIQKRYFQGKFVYGQGPALPEDKK